jgi:hypothetical protein|tara:strand:+ start:379 stop:519 length:141 start_codon:yes stop_codon:yes gene_type:complete
MTNLLAVWLFLIVVAAIAADLFFGWGGTLFLMRKFANLVEWTAFWR